VITVRIEDNIDAVRDELRDRVWLLLNSVASELVEVYKNDSTGLGRIQSFLTEEGPPHSAPGEVPHYYNGPRPGGYSSPAPGSAKNNAPGSGFAVDQEAPLFEFIDYTITERGSGTMPEAGVGFNLQTSDSGAPAHVVNRQKNYLIGWDIGIGAAASGGSRRTPGPGEVIDRKTGQIRKRRTNAGRPRTSAPKSTGGGGKRPWVRPLYDQGVPRLKAAILRTLSQINQPFDLF